MDTLQTLLAEYEAYRASARALAQKRREEIYAASPRLKEISLLRMRLHFEHGRQLLGLSQSGEDIPAALKQLEAEEASLLAALHVEPAALAPQYRCAQCMDTGYVGDSVRQMCVCLQKRLLQAKCKDAGLGASDASFDAFNSDIFPDDVLDNEKISQRRLMQRLLVVTKSYAEQFPHTQKPNLLLLGETGLGKTYAMDCIAKFVLERGYVVLKRTAYALLNHALQLIQARDNTGMSIFLQADLLLIDDLGSEPFIDNISNETLFSVLNERLIQGKHTIIATNLRMLDLHERYGERIFTRISAQSDIIQLQGRDIRLLSRK